MDGVLEVRWEDLIKREPELPECVRLGKRLEDYSDEETLAVGRYEQEMRNLESERAKYRKILQIDYAKISEALAEGIDRFNSRLEDFHLVQYIFIYTSSVYDKADDVLSIIIFALI